MLPDCNRLIVFYYIYSGKSNAAAARELHITQSAVSQHLKKLESEIHTPLFTRFHKKLVPTSAGESLFRIVKPFVEELEAGIRDLKKARKTPAGLLRVGVPVEFGREYMAGIFASFRKKHPGVTLFLRLGDPGTLMPLLEQGALDFAYVDVFSDSPQFFTELRSFSIEPLIEEDVILACSRPYYDKNIRGNHSLQHLMNQDFITYRMDAHAIQSWFKFSLGRPSASVNAVLTVDSVQAVVSAIKSHLGLGVIVSHLVSEEIDAGRIVAVRIPGKNVVNHISLVQLSGKKPSLAERSFQRHLRNEMRPGGILGKFCASRVPFPRND